ncbi:MAG: ion transporter [Rhodanobacter sp.]
MHLHLGAWFYALEWLFTLAFTLEYLIGLAVVKRRLRYAGSFFGVVDLLSVLPTWISLVMVGSQYLLVIRALRILRIFRVLKLSPYVGEANLLWSALVRTRRKILIFISTILTLVLIFGALMYLVEGPAHGFTSIPKSMYWPVVTMTTVAFGDITPKTVLGQLLTSLIMLVGYSIIAVPTGIFHGRTRLRHACAKEAKALCGLRENPARRRRPLLQGLWQRLVRQGRDVRMN